MGDRIDGARLNETRDRVDESRDSSVGRQSVTRRPIAHGRSSRRRRAVPALLVVLLACLAVVACGELGSSTPGVPGVHADVAQVEDLGSDSDQQATASHLAADVAAMPTPASAAQITAACDLADRMTRPLALGVDRWLHANCVDEQTPHDGARYDIGPLDRE